MIIRCDGTNEISTRSMTELPAWRQPIATGMPTREQYSVYDRDRCANRAACGMTRPPPLRLAVLLRNGALRPRT